MSKTHGMIYTSEYRIWSSMIQRCSNRNATGYKNYGARGIEVCKRWSKFENFFQDMGNRPANKTLDRINNDGNYEPSNCRWATRKEQAHNSRYFIRDEFSYRNMDKGARHRKRNIRSGKCAICCEPRVNAWYCIRHRDYYRMKGREYYMRKKQKEKDK